MEDTDRWSVDVAHDVRWRGTRRYAPLTRFEAMVFVQRELGKPHVLRITIRKVESRPMNRETPNTLSS